MSTRTSGPTGADSGGIESCPKCGGTSGVKTITDTEPGVWAWSCGERGEQWRITIVNPHVRRAFLDHLAVEVTARAVLQEITTLANQVDTLTDGQLLARLINCWARLDEVCRRSAASGFPAGHRLNNEVPGAPSVPRTTR